MRVTLSPILSLLPRSYLEALRRRASGVSCTLARLRCCLCRCARFDTGGVCSAAGSGDGLIQLVGELWGDGSRARALSKMVCGACGERSAVMGSSGCGRRLRDGMNAGQSRLRHARRDCNSWTELSLVPGTLQD